MKRHVLNLLSAASLLLGVALGVLWVRSYRRVDTGKVVIGEQSIGFCSAWGDVSFFFNSRRPPEA